MKKHFKAKCNWKCVALVFMFLTVALAAIVAYFVGKFKQQITLACFVQEKGSKQEQSHGRKIVDFLWWSLQLMREINVENTTGRNLHHATRRRC